MSTSIPYALVRRPAARDAKPVAFTSLADLCAAIHRARGKRSLTMLNSPLLFEGEAKARQGVSVWAVDLANEQGEFIGWAWLDGGGRTRLTSALEASEPQAAYDREAA